MVMRDLGVTFGENMDFTMRRRCCMNFDDLLYIAMLQHQVLWPMHLRYFESASCMLSNILDQPLINRKTRLEGKYLFIPKCVIDWTMDTFSLPYSLYYR